MTIPHPLQQLGLFAAQWYQPVDTSSQVDRMPGTADAPCLCDLCEREEREKPDCTWPFCPWKPTESEDE